MKCHLVLNLCVAACLLQGCGVSMFVPPEEDAVVDEHVFFSWNEIFGLQSTSLRALSTKAERRLVLMEQWTDSDDSTYFTVCAEPNPEATQSLNSLSKTSGDVSEKAGEVVKGLAEFTRQLVTNVKTTFTRSQGLQFYRDSAFQLCQAYFNGLIIDANEKNCKLCYLDRLKELEKAAVELIKKEVEHGFYTRTPPK